MGVFVMTNIVKGSLSAIAQAANTSLAEAFMHADTVIIVDTSGSMASRDHGDSQTRYERACKELATLQANLQGRIAVIAFSNEVEFCPGGVPTFFGGGTQMAKALKFAHVADQAVDRFILISDGEPHDETETLKQAKRFKTKIDCIFVGAEGSAGAEFLKRLAAASGGTSQAIKGASLLSERIEVLMLTAA